MKHATGRLLAGSDVDLQTEREKHSIDEGVLRYNRIRESATRRDEASQLKPAERLMIYWVPTLADTIKRDRDRYTSDFRGDEMVGHAIWGPVYRSVEPERIAVVALSRVLSILIREPNGEFFSKVAFELGRAIAGEYNHDRLSEDKLWKDLCWKYKLISYGRVNWYANKNLTERAVQSRMLAHLGSRIAWNVIESCLLPARNKDDPPRLAFRRKTIVRNGKQMGMMFADDVVYDAIEDGHDIRQFLRPIFRAMIVPPCAWVRSEDGGVQEGGYYTLRTPFMSKPRRCNKEAMREADLTRSISALNAVGGMSFRIIKPMLEVAETLQRSGLEVPSMPSRANLAYPPKPDSDDVEVVKEWKNECGRITASNRALRCERRTFELKLDCAREYAEHEVVYFPHQYDFRGRMYAIPTNLNHYGDDFCRGVMEAGEGYEPDLGELAIEAANQFGVDKVSFSDRMKWTSDNLDMIRSVADDPVGDTSWFAADKPWQFLAVCMAITGKTDPRHAIVRRDGTCNGLQHYVALGRDQKAAPIVNLTDTDIPQSVYTEVSLATMELLAKSTDPFAARVMGMVDRKMCKPGVMTHYYGVTPVKAAQQVRFEMIDRGFDRKDKDIYKIALFLSATIKQAIGTVCERADKIMEWLRNSSVILARNGKLFSLVGPTGFPMVQRYRNPKKFTIETIAQKLLIVDDEADLPPLRGKQKNGSAPNTIHMLDAAHMVMTLERMVAERAWFVTVHDSYWSHSGRAALMNRHLREAFVEMHENYGLENIYNQLSALGAVEAPPSVGTFDLREVVNAKYFFA